MAKRMNSRYELFEAALYLYRQSYTFLSPRIRCIKFYVVTVVETNVSSAVNSRIG